MAFKNGDVLKQRVFVVEGIVTDVRYDAESGRFQYLLEYTDEDSNVQRRWFDETQVEVA